MSEPTQKSPPCSTCGQDRGLAHCLENVESIVASQHRKLGELRRQLAEPPRCWCGKVLKPAPGEVRRWSPCEDCLELVAEGAAESAMEAPDIAECQGA